MENSKSLKWFNSLSQTKRNELSFDYYGTDLLMDSDIEQIYLNEYRYYIEFVGKKFLCVFPFGAEKSKEKEFKTLNEALDYMLIDCEVAEVTIKN